MLKLVYFAAQIGSAALAIAAAAYWYRSTLVKTPSRFSVHVVRPNMGPPLGANPLGGTYVGTAHSSDLQELTGALKEQSRRNMIGSICAAGAALLQTLAAVLALVV